MKHPWYACLTLILMVVVCWISAWIILNSRVCVVCGDIRCVPHITTRFPFYCENCMKEVN